MTVTYVKNLSVNIQGKQKTETNSVLIKFYKLLVEYSLYKFHRLSVKVTIIALRLVISSSPKELHLFFNSENTKFKCGKTNSTTMIFLYCYKLNRCNFQTFVYSSFMSKKRGWLMKLRNALQKFRKKKLFCII